MHARTEKNDIFQSFFLSGVRFLDFGVFDVGAVSSNRTSVTLVSSLRVVLLA